MQRKDILIKALRSGGAEILKHDPAQLSTTVKSTAGDFVTEADIASENVIIETIKSAFPDDIVVSEETKEGQELLEAANLDKLTAWVVDPLDGTNNMKRGMSFSGVSIGYIKNGKAVLGGIYDPFLKKLYLAELGKGATLEGKPLHVSDVSEFNGAARVCTSNSADPGGTKVNLRKFLELPDVWIDVSGSATLVMAGIARGSFDLYFHNGLKPWDNAAGLLLVTEAGGKFVGLKGQPVEWPSNEIVVGNPTLVDLFVELTNK